MKRKIAALGGLAALAAVGGTWAYFNQTAAITNPFHTEGRYETSVIEHFNPAEGEDWKPGVTVDKDVIARNTGYADVLVRVKMDEKWTLAGGAEKEIGSDEGTKFTVPRQENATDGLTEADDTVVDKTIDSTSWTFNVEDGYWYYNSRLAAKTDSAPLLSDVTLLDDLDMGFYTDTVAYYITSKPDEKLSDDYDTDYAGDGSTATEGWVEVDDESQLTAIGEKAKAAGLYFHVRKGTVLDAEKTGYANADYDLTITIEFVQPTEDAVRDAWGGDALRSVGSLLDEVYEAPTDGQ